MRSLINTLSFILRHPLNQGRKITALSRFLRWQLGSRMQLGAVAVPFVDSTRLLVRPGMTGATGNVYCGLHEFNDMGFLLHLLRPGDLFADVGANIGSYTVLAAGAAGADCVCFEPVPDTFAHLVDNVRINGLESKVSTRNVAVGAAAGTLSFTAGLGPQNHVVGPNESAFSCVEVSVAPLDDALGAARPCLVKIDVEGFETEVLQGAGGTMESASLLAVIIELNGSGVRYGYDDEKIHQRLTDWGFSPAAYDPLRRILRPLLSHNAASGNTLYVRDMECVQQRVASAPRHTVLGVSL